jgi:hypothetical protein
MRTTLQKSSREIKKEIMRIERDKNNLGRQIRTKAESSADIKVFVCVCVCVFIQSLYQEIHRLSLRYVRCDTQITRLETTIDKLTQFGTVLSEAQINGQLSKAFVGLTKCITNMNRISNPQQLCLLIQHYERQNQLMEMGQEILEEKSMYMMMGVGG